MDMGRDLDICDALKLCQETMQKAYPNAAILMLGSDLHFNEQRIPERRTRLTHTADWDQLISIASEVAKTDRGFEGFIANVKSGMVVKAREINKLASLGNEDNGTHIMGQKVQPGYLEQHITQLELELKRLKAQRNPEYVIRTMEAEIKRIRRSGKDMEALRAKEKELEEIKASFVRAEQLRKTRLENLRKARYAKAEKKRRLEQQERDRQRQQPNFAKQAKKKMQKMAERKAEKRKKSSTGSDSLVKSCSMFQNAG